MKKQVKKNGAVATVAGTDSARNPNDLMSPEILIPIRNIVAVRNPRTEFEQTAIQELADSIEQHGQLSAVVVALDPQSPIMLDAKLRQQMMSDLRAGRLTVVDKFGHLRTHPDIETMRFELIMGERRLRAHQLLGLEMIRATIRLVEDATEHTVLALVENLHRRDLNPIEEARGYATLRGQGLSNDEIARRLQKNPSVISNALRLLDLPEDVQDAIVRGEISNAHGKALARFKAFPQVASKVAQLVIEQRTPAKQIEKGLPFKYELTRAKLVVDIDGYSPLPAFDYKSICTACPYKAAAEIEENRAGQLRLVCLRPDHFEELDSAGRAVEMENARKAAEKFESAKGTSNGTTSKPSRNGNAKPTEPEERPVPKFPKLSHDSHEKLQTYSAADLAGMGCGRQCACRGYAVDYHGRPVEVCLDKKTFMRKKIGLTKKSNRSRRDQLLARHGEARKFIIGSAEITSRFLLALLQQYFMTGKTVATRVATVLKSMGVEKADEMRSIDDLEALPPHDILRAAMLIHAQNEYDEAHKQVQHISRPMPRTNYLLSLPASFEPSPATVEEIEEEVLT